MVQQTTRFFLLTFHDFSILFFWLEVLKPNFGRSSCSRTGTPCSSPALLPTVWSGSDDGAGPSSYFLTSNFKCQPSRNYEKLIETQGLLDFGWFWCSSKKNGFAEEHLVLCQWCGAICNFQPTHCRTMLDTCYVELSCDLGQNVFSIS